MKGLLLFLLAGGIIGCAIKNPQPIPTISIKDLPAIETTKLSINGIKISVGTQAVIPNWTWVDVVGVNRDTLERNKIRIQQVATRCGVESGGIITVVEAGEDTVMVEYLAPGNPGGTQCVSGIRYTETQANFAALTQKYIEKETKIRTDQVLVTALLAFNYVGEITDAGNWHWVDIQNVRPVRQWYSIGFKDWSYGDTCGAGRAQGVEGGTIQVKGKAGERVLYEYTARGNPRGTPCPTGILFWQ